MFTYLLTREGEVIYGPASYDECSAEQERLIAISPWDEVEIISEEVYSFDEIEEW